MVAFLRLALRRIAMLPVMVLGIVLLVFAVMQFSPTDPAYAALGEGATPEAREAFAEERGLNDPFFVRYFHFLGNLIHLDLGMTVPPSTPVTERIATAFPLTFQLTLYSLVLTVVFAVAAGVIGAVFRDRWPDQVFRFLSMAGVAIPSFWLALLLIQRFALSTPVFPTGGYINPSESFTGWLWSMTMPAASIALAVSSSLARLIRTSMVSELDRDYVRTARGSGLPERMVLGSVLRNALVNPLTVLGVKIGYMLSGAVVIEAIFDLPGMGKLILEGVTGNDAGLVQGTVLTIAVAFLAVNVLVDLLYLLVNPRIRTV